MLGVWTTLEVSFFGGPQFLSLSMSKTLPYVYAIEYPSIFSALLEVDPYDDEISPMN